MTLSSEIIGVQTLKAGDRVGYGGRYTASGEQRIGIVAAGYADGYPVMPLRVRRYWWMVCEPLPLAPFQWICWRWI